MLVVEASLMAFLSLLSFDAFSSTQLYVYSVSKINLISIFNNSDQLYICFKYRVMLGQLGCRGDIFIPVLRARQWLGYFLHPQYQLEQWSFSHPFLFALLEEERKCSRSVDISLSMINQFEPSCQIKPIYIGSQSLYNSLGLIKYSEQQNSIYNCLFLIDLESAEEDVS